MRLTIDDGLLRPIRIDVPKPALVIIHCAAPGCGYQAIAQTEGRTLTALAGHIVYAHIQEQR